MSRQAIYLGAAANDGSGTDLRTLLGQINDMTTEIYELRGKILDLSAVTLNDADDLYAHESNIVITKVGNNIFLLLLYMSNKVVSTEWQTTAKAVLKVFNLATMAYITKFDLFYPGLSAGVTMDADKEINAPRMYVTGTTLKCFCPNTATLYTRDIDISGSDPTAWSPGNISIAQMTMKDSGGNNVLANVTSANIQTHLNYVFGDSAANYANLMPLFRNLDSPAKMTGYWHATLECTSERSHNLDYPTIAVVSTDLGVSWTLAGAIGYTTHARGLFLLGILVNSDDILDPQSNITRFFWI